MLLIVLVSLASQPMFAQDSLRAMNSLSESIKSVLKFDSAAYVKNKNSFYLVYLHMRDKAIDSVSTHSDGPLKNELIEILRTNIQGTRISSTKLPSIITVPILLSNPRLDNPDFSPKEYESYMSMKLDPSDKTWYLRTIVFRNGIQGKDIRRLGGQK